MKFLSYKISLFIAFWGLFVQSSFAQSSANELIRDHVRKLRALADSLEKSAEKMVDLPVAASQASSRNSSTDVHEKKIYVDAEHRVFWQAGLPVYIFLSSKPEGEDKTRIKAQKVKQMETFSDPMYWEGHGVHTLKHQDERPNREVAFQIYSDGMAPISTLELKNAPKYVLDGRIFFGQGLIAEVRTADEMSGVNQTFFSIDSAEFQTYQNTLPFEENKEFTLQYYGVDKVGNKESFKSIQFTVDLEAPESSHKVSGDIMGDIYAPTAIIELASKDKLAGVAAIKFKFNDEAYQTYTGPIKLTAIKEGEHTLTYYGIDQVSNKEVEKSFTFYLDKTSPSIVAEVVGDQHQNRGRVFISSRTNMRLTAADEKAGVMKVYYTIDGGVERLYTEPFPLVKSEGTHIIKFFAIDKVKNQGMAVSNDSYENIYLDLVMPDVSHSFTGPQVLVNDTLHITSGTQINVLAKDNDSGIKKVGYKIDGTRTNPYTAPFTLEETGPHTVEYYAMDNVNNRIAKEFMVSVDNQGPDIQISFSMKPIGSIKTDDLAVETQVYPLGTYLFLAATDAKVGIQKILYSVDNGPELQYVTPLLLREKGIKTIKVKAIDQLGNEKEAEMLSFFLK
jgi:Chitobiase/beta-hexosaminidase C-terminal domain